MEQGRLVSAISEFWTFLLMKRLLKSSSGVKHIEEIKTFSNVMPAVNQVEVGLAHTFLHCSHLP